MPIAFDWVFLCAVCVINCNAFRGVLGPLSEGWAIFAGLATMALLFGGGKSPLGIVTRSHPAARAPRMLTVVAGVGIWFWTRA